MAVMLSLKKLALDVIVFVFLLVFFYVSHSWLASLSVKEFISKYSQLMFSFYRLFYTLFSVTLWSIITWWFIYQHEYNYIITPRTGLMYTGYVMAAVGLLLISLSVIKYGFQEFVGLNALNKNQRIENAAPELNISGMNGFVRHPIYSGILLALVGLFLCLPTQMTALGIVVSLIYLEIGIRLEEIKLEKEFGSSYTQYKMKVKKVIPRLY